MFPQIHSSLLIHIFILIYILLLIITFSSVGLFSIATGMLPQAHSGPEETWIRQLERKKPLPGLQGNVNKKSTIYPHLKTIF